MKSFVQPLVLQVVTFAGFATPSLVQNFVHLGLWLPVTEQCAHPLLHFNIPSLCNQSANPVATLCCIAQQLCSHIQTSNEY